MKKIFLFAAAAAMLTACSNEELSNQEVAQQNAETPVAFSIYTSKTRAGAPQTITTASLQTGAHADYGFGVFGYFTDASVYGDYSTPNFMYNQQVKWNAGENEWRYEPVKYWPNEYGNAATSDDVDRVTFFAYAPWTAITPATGVPVGGIAEDEKNIISVSKNSASGDPIIKYVVDVDGNTSVDLLWGVYAGKDPYTTTWGSATTTVQPGMPFINLMKPNNPATTAYTSWDALGGEFPTNTTDNKVRFNLRHALAKLNVTIDYIDDKTSEASNYNNGEAKIEASKETKIWVREVKIGGFMMKGALNLNNTEANKPNWKAFDGVSDLEYEVTTFKDGRRDGREGTPDGEAASEKYLGLNPALIQSTEYETEVVGDNTFFTAPWNTANKGVLNAQQTLFGKWNKTTKTWEEGDLANNDIYVIPMEKPIDVEILYDVETVNPKLAGKLSDNLTPGKSIENKIKKTSVQIFGAETKMEAGKYYTLNLHLGMTSVKVEAHVYDWTDKDGTAVLPENN